MKLKLIHKTDYEKAERDLITYEELGRIMAQKILVKMARKMRWLFW